MSTPEIQQPQSDSPAVVLASPASEVVANPNVTDFERNLFADGVYVYNPAAELADAESDIARMTAWYRDNWDIQRAHDSLSDDVSQKRWELSWKQHFSGQVPKDWEMWDAPMMDVEQAGKRGLQLSETLIDAAISHEHHLVANTAGTLQDLNTHQLAIAFARELPRWNIDEIVEAQVKRGMSGKQVAEARRMAEDIRKRMSKGTIQLRSETPEITQPTPRKRTIKGVLKGTVSYG